MNRSEYLAPYVSDEEAAVRHRRYYGQFVTSEVTKLVDDQLGARVRASTAKNFSDVPLRYWDDLVPFIRPDVRQLLKAAGDSLTLGGGICILKEAARQLRERAQRDRGDQAEH